MIIIFNKPSAWKDTPPPLLPPHIQFRDIQNRHGYLLKIIIYLLVALFKPSYKHMFTDNYVSFHRYYTISMHNLLTRPWKDNNSYLSMRSHGHTLLKNEHVHYWFLMKMPLWKRPFELLIPRLALSACEIWRKSYHPDIALYGPSSKVFCDFVFSCYDSLYSWWPVRAHRCGKQRFGNRAKVKP